MPGRRVKLLLPWQSGCQAAKEQMTGEDNFRLLPGSVLDSQLLPHFARDWQPTVDFQTASCPKDISLGWQTTARCRKKKDRFLFCSQNNHSWYFASKRGKRATLIQGSSAPRAAGTRGRGDWSKEPAPVPSTAFPPLFNSAQRLPRREPTSPLEVPASAGARCALGPVLRPRSVLPRQPLASSSGPVAPGSPC